jgi:3',5'-cyclic-AMP phosphodiesterase
MLKIAQISDIHIGEINQLVPEIDTKEHFLKVLKDVRNENADLIILTGDLGLKETHGWLKDVLENCGLKYYFALGNHDHIQDLLKTFDLKDKVKKNKLVYKINVQDHSLYFLDSSNGRISGGQLKWLKSEGEREKGEILLFLHYPVVQSGSAFMDKYYPLKNPGTVYGVIKEIKNLNHIFCGHYHTDKIVDLNGKKLYLAPSTWFQINRDSITLKIDSTNPGYRIIEWDGKDLLTKVKYID